MQNGPKYLIGGTLVLLVVAGVRVGLIYKANHEEAPARVAATTAPLDPDDNVYIAKQHPDSLADERALIGKTLWISAGGQMDYYRDTGKHVDYAKPLGVLLGAEPIVVKEVFEQKAPATGRAVFRVPAGVRQVLLGFTLPKSADPKALYALSVGDYDGSYYNFVSDEIFFYDDPHELYKHWGDAMWKTIDAHQAVLGMSENQAMMSLGEVTVPHGDTMGDRTVDFDNNGHPLSIKFVKNKAVSITQGS
jgi:hypothetical protein